MPLQREDDGRVSPLARYKPRETDQGSSVSSDEDELTSDNHSEGDLWNGGYAIAVGIVAAIPLAWYLGDEWREWLAIGVVVTVLFAVIFRAYFALLNIERMMRDNR